VIIVVMGVAGSGKTTIGQLLAARLHCTFVDADSLHSPANVEKMAHGIPLNDTDRAPWLEAVHDRIAESFERKEDLVVACSALKQKYRDTLARDVTIAWVYLKGSAELIGARMRARAHHYMKPAMLASQIADLEEPTNAIVVDISNPPDAAVDQVLSALPAGSRPA
jgi:gluconokinase